MDICAIIRPVARGLLCCHGLRFAIGTRVKCNTSAGWAPGVVTQHNYRELGWAAERLHVPYQVQLDDGRLIFAPLDVDRVIKLLDSDSDPRVD